MFVAVNGVFEDPFNNLEVHKLEKSFGLSKTSFGLFWRETIFSELEVLKS